MRADNQLITRRVGLGTIWLDQTRHRWRGLIDRSTLDLASYEHCVLGQLEGTYWRGQCTITEGMGLTPPQALQWCIDHGFILAATKGNTMNYRALTRAWLSELESA